MFVTYLPWSEVPFMYPMFIHYRNPKNHFSPEEVNAMLSKDNTYLLPGFHYERRKMIAWMVSNGQPNNNRDSFAYMLSTYIAVSFDLFIDPCPKLPIMNAVKRLPGCLWKLITTEQDSISNFFCKTNTLKHFTICILPF